MNINNLYNINLAEIKYSNNTEYRDCLRKAFYMTCDLEHLLEENPDYDDETIDEELYNSEQSSNIINFIYEKTKDNNIFKKIYLHAAAKIISTSPDLGLVILFSYDFFYIFHNCLIEFFNNGVLYEENVYVQEILNN